MFIMGFGCNFFMKTFMGDSWLFYAFYSCCDCKSLRACKVFSLSFTLDSYSGLFLAAIFAASLNGLS